MAQGSCGGRIDHPDPLRLMTSQSQIAEMANVSSGYTNRILAARSAQVWMEVEFLRVHMLGPTVLGDFASGDR